MILPADHVSLDERLGDVLTFSERLLPDPEESSDRLGLGREGRFVLLLLWGADGMPERRIAERLGGPADLVERTLKGLEQHALIERADDAADVWLTPGGRAVGEQVGRRTLGDRLRTLRNEVGTLRDLLRDALTLAVRRSEASEARVAYLARLGRTI